MDTLVLIVYVLLNLDADGEEDEFLTPSATPPDEVDFAKEVFDTNLPEEIIRERFYDRCADVCYFGAFAFSNKHFV